MNGKRGLICHQTLIHLLDKLGDALNVFIGQPGIGSKMPGYHLGDRCVTRRRLEKGIDQQRGQLRPAPTPEPSKWG
jgi:hypothetical protein